jgi:hypothetical protein
VKIAFFIIILLLPGCDVNDLKSDEKFNASSLNMVSNYAGKISFINFFKCLGRETKEVKEIYFSFDPLNNSYWPSSYRDLLSLGGYSVEGFEFLRPENVRPFKLAFPEDYKNLKYASTFIDDKHRAANFRKDYYNYTSSQDVASIALIPSDWYDSLIYIGGNQVTGSHILLNPMVQTQDSEWEVWLYDPRYPGAYRFLSVAEVISHLRYSYEVVKGEDEYRYGQSEVDDICSKVLFPK